MRLEAWHELCEKAVMVQPYRHILIATDFSEPAEKAVKLGVDLVQRFAARVTLLHVYDATVFERAVAPLSIGHDELEKQMADSARAELERIASSQLADAEGVDCMPVPGSSPALTIVDHAKDHGVDLCIVGTHGRTGFRRVFSGSVAERVVRHASCDVLVVRQEPAAWPPEQILVGTDFSEASDPAATRASEIANALKATLTVAYVFDETVPIALPDGTFESLEHAETRLQKRAAEIAQSLEGPARSELLHGPSPAHALCEHARKPGSLVVVGTHGRQGMAQLLIGSVAERVVRYAPTAALIVRSGEQPPRSHEEP
jgi:nucleotide-binding universal stress UspA family protein